jgi:endonuclease/exonuclease/phosphatase family metal-dependent hydrolase
MRTTGDRGRIRRRLRLLLPVLFCLVSASLAAVSQAPAREPLAVMSFNIRYGTANDGDNHWTRRREMLFDLLRDEDADLVGLQEALRGQVDEILAAVPAYAAVGVGRDDGRAAGETAAILFRRDRFHVAGAGTFWLSDTPSVPGSRSWGNTITRIATWARFVDHDGSAFWQFNVHMDHQSQPSRERSARLLVDRIGERAQAVEPVVVTGDFNAGEDNPAIHVLVGAPDAAGGALPQFMDTFRVLHPAEPEAGTFNAFTMGTTTGPKIDYVLVQPGTTVLAASIVRASRDGRYPSDHFPVTARMLLPPPASTSGP